jgi:3-isopropylmalate dehydrogenase
VPKASIAALLGDGIGPDIVHSTVAVLSRAAELQGVELSFTELPAGLEALRGHGSTFPAATREALTSYDGWILGPVSHHGYDFSNDQYINPSSYLRKHFELYANVRPARSLPGVRSLVSDVDLVIVRENTEGFYADRNVMDGTSEFRPNEDLVLSLRVVSRKACLRIARRAFEIAVRRDRRRLVTAVHKANVLRQGDGLFLECCRQVAAEFENVAYDEVLVDAFSMYLVMRPQSFDVVVTTNMFGDILSDEAAGLIGGLGLAPGLNAGDQRAMAQATHGSAPDIADLHTANPTAEILSGKLLLDWLADRRGETAFQRVAASVETAVLAVLADGRVKTPDLGGTANTREFTRAIVDKLS